MQCDLLGSSTLVAAQKSGLDETYILDETNSDNMNEAIGGRGWTIEEAITRTVREFLAECELEEKIIKFPKGDPRARIRVERGFSLLKYR